MNEEVKRFLCLWDKIKSGEIKVADDTQISQCDYRLCAENRITPENIEGKCSQCSKTVYMEPGYPDGPKLICITCALEKVKGNQSFAE